MALDLRGYGESDKPETKSGYKMRKVIEDIRQFVLSLGITPTILLLEYINYHILMFVLHSRKAKVHLGRPRLGRFAHLEFPRFSH